MKVQILHIPDCPNLHLVTARLAEVLADRGPVEVETVVIRTRREAAARGMTGSPTVLVDGADPFARPGDVPSLSCRLYVDDTGRTVGAPSVTQLRAALAGKGRSSASG